MRSLVTLLLLIAASSVTAQYREKAEQYEFRNVTYLETAAWKPDTVPDARFVYGDDSAPQFVDLRLPSKSIPADGHPVILFIHGGGWRSEWSKNHTEAFVEALARQGFATWDLEFRRIGHGGGGYPGTFEDIADGADYLRVAAESYPLDLDRIIAVGHSSGGHLALWLAGRESLPETSPLHRIEPLKLAGVISIAGVNDLELAYNLGDRTDVLTLVDADSPGSGEQRFMETNPARMLPFGIPQTLIIGDKDAPWRLQMTERYAEQVTAEGDTSRVIIAAGANHMDVVDPRSGFAERVALEARLMLQR